MLSPSTQEPEQKPKEVGLSSLLDIGKNPFSKDLTEEERKAEEERMAALEKKTAPIFQSNSTRRVGFGSSIQPIVRNKPRREDSADRNRPNGSKLGKGSIPQWENGDVVNLILKGREERQVEDERDLAFKEREGDKEKILEAKYPKVTVKAGSFKVSGTKERKFKPKPDFEGISEIETDNTWGQIKTDEILQQEKDTKEKLNKIRSITEKDVEKLAQNSGKSFPDDEEGPSEGDKFLAEARNKRIQKKPEKGVEKIVANKETKPPATDPKVEPAQPADEPDLREKLRAIRAKKEQGSEGTGKAGSQADKQPEKPSKIIEKEKAPSRPLRTSYEIVSARLNGKEKNLVKKITNPSIDTNAEIREKIFPNKQEGGLKEKISEATSFEDLIETINSIDGIQGSQKWFSKNSLLGRLHLVQVGEMTFDQIPLEGGLREKVMELQTKNGPLIYKPEEYSHKNDMQTKNPLEEKAVVTPQKTERGPEADPRPETNAEKSSIPPEKKEDIEKEVREKINTLIGEKFTSSLNTLNAARKEYCYQLTKKTQHDNTQSKIGRLVASLQSMVFAKKPSENAAIFEKASEVYFLSIQAFIKCLNDKDLNDKLALLAGKENSKGVDIIREEKEKMWEPLIRQILVLEKKTICEAEEKSLPEKDRNMLDRMQILYRKSRWNKELSDKKPSFLEKIEGILKSESSEKHDY